MEDFHVLNKTFRLISNCYASAKNSFIYGQSEINLFADQDLAVGGTNNLLLFRDVEETHTLRILLYHQSTVTYTSKTKPHYQNFNLISLLSTGHPVLYKTPNNYLQLFGWNKMF